MHTHTYNPDMLSVEEALEKVLGLVSVLESERRPLAEVLGQVLAEDAIARFNIPPWDNSAMDGYAVRYQDIRGAGTKSQKQLRPKLLRVVGSVAAGQMPYQEVVKGTAIRIMTGAPIPAGADTVVPFEETDEVERQASGRPLDEIAILEEVPKEGNVRRAAEDVATGEVILPKGTVLRPSEIGVLASLGYDPAPVIRRPQVAILSTGDELLEPSQPLESGRIYDSNSYGVAALVTRYGGVPKVLGIARDNLDSLNRMLDKSATTDMLITSAGVSKGDYDMVKDVLANRGEMTFWSVRMRPAKPLAFGTMRGAKGRPIPHLGLPGNPVSAMVAFEEFVRPALLKMMGRANLEKLTVEAVLEEPIVNGDGRRVYARVVVTKREGTYYARLTGSQESNILTSMAKANGLAICPDDVSLLKKGERVLVQMLDWN